MTVRRTLVALSSLAMLAGCATTYDPTAARPTNAVVTTTTVPTGSTAALLAQLKSEAQRLEVVIQRKGDVAASMQRINALWSAVAQPVAQTEPDLVSRFEGAIRLAKRGADSKRMGHATRAGLNISALVDAYLAKHPT